MAGLFILYETVEDAVELFLAVDAESTAKGCQIDGFFEVSMFRAEHHWAAESDGFLDVVDVDAESASYIDETGILVELRQDSDGVQNQYLAGLFGVEVCIALKMVQHGAELVDVFFGDVVRSDDHAVVVGQMAEIGNQQLLVGWPSAAGNDTFSASEEDLYVRERLDLSGDGGDPVESGVAAESHIGIACLLQQVVSDLVLDKEMRYMVELLAEPPSVSFEKILIRLQDQ